MKAALFEWMEIRLEEFGLIGKPVTLCVSGGRDFDDRELMLLCLRTLTRFVYIREVIQGGAAGADRMADEMCRKARLTVRTLRARWKTQGNGAGPIRNQDMVDARPDLVLAMPGGDGTFDMIQRSRAAGIAVLDVDEFLLAMP